MERIECKRGSSFDTCEKGESVAYKKQERTAKRSTHVQPGLKQQAPAKIRDKTFMMLCRGAKGEKRMKTRHHSGKKEAPTIA
jgi:hypothetical protein